LNDGWIESAGLLSSLVTQAFFSSVLRQESLSSPESNPQILKREKMNSGSLNRPSLVTAWPRKPNTRAAILQRIQVLTKELESLQAEMHTQLTGPVAGQSSSFFDDPEAVQVLNGLKAELDQFRRILWFYAEEAAKKPASGSVLQSKTKQSEAQPRLPLQNSGTTGAAQPAWYFDRLELVIESYIQKKPAAPELQAGSRRDTKVFS
jgi:hypothetical protein